MGLCRRPAIPGKPRNAGPGECRDDARSGVDFPNHMIVALGDVQVGGRIELNFVRHVQGSCGRRSAVAASRPSDRCRRWWPSGGFSSQAAGCAGCPDRRSTTCDRARSRDRRDCSLRDPNSPWTQCRGEWIRMALPPALTTGRKQAPRPLGLRDDLFSDPSSTPRSKRERLNLYRDGYT